MNNSKFLVSAVLAIVGFVACDHNSNNATTSQVVISSDQNLASNLPETKKSEMTVFTDFIYDVGPRFGPIKKRNLDKATSIDAFISEEELEAIVHLRSVTVILIVDDEQTERREIGNSAQLTAAQLKLLQSSNYDTNFMIRVEYQQKNKQMNRLENNYASPYLTVVPEKQASYVNGTDALKEYLKENSEEVRDNVDPEKLQPAKLYFTVTKDATIENVRLDRPSGYPSVDKKMIQLINQTLGKWEPAENMKGKKVDQELVVSFGLMGC